MYCGPPEVNAYQKFLQGSCLVDAIYEALKSEDPAKVVMLATGCIRETADFNFEKEFKSEEKSNEYRNEGNRFYAAQRFRKALECYNQALLYAPENSQAMKLAYSNRSALLFTIKAYTACLNDIEMFFSMGCTDFKLVERLRKRKRDCLKHSWTEKAELITNAFHHKFFELSKHRHPDIPCASKDVAVVMESGRPKIIAANNIPVGKVIAVESPFVSELGQDNYLISCHYCHNHSLNLIPCDGCCLALFCSEKCKSKCKEEYHNIECNILPKENYIGPASLMKVRAALKMKKMCKSWQELIAASLNIGEDRMRNSSISDIYNVNSKFSLLSYCNPSSHFVYGERYNQSFSCAVDLLALLQYDDSSFFPSDTDEKFTAVCALARIMMHLYSSYRKIGIYNAAKDVCTQNCTTNTEINYGWYSFTGKLNHSCDANLYMFGLNNKIALMTIKPVKKGEELTISFLGHYLEDIVPNRMYNIFTRTQEICQCKVCVENWSTVKLRNVKLTPGQKQAFAVWSSLVRTFIPGNRDEKVFKCTLEALTAMQGAECTKEHYELFRELRTLTSFCQFVATNNQFIQKDDEEYVMFG